MKKVIICICCIFMLCGCAEGYKGDTNTQSAAEVTVTAPKDNSVNGYRTPITDEGNEIYIANSSSKKFHTPSCSYATKMKAENKREYSSRQRLIAEGYEPCKSCNP